eukprot:GDKK01025588.1.p1 GENE.GDKK01025588.1~~GDKK01025588.1.p1  ORF type:complete len:131 (+),score=23.62 GDKK01025588.1:77-469(+)
MPLYQQILMMLPKAPKDKMVKILQQQAKIVLESGGNYRGVENHGIRPLPERTRRQFAVVNGPRHFWEARYVTTTFDASPAALVEIGRLFRNEENVLRAFTIKRKASIFRATGENYKNPYFHLDKPKEEIA